jgi:hypothetical protein
MELAIFLELFVFKEVKSNGVSNIYGDFCISKKILELVIFMEIFGFQRKNN